MFSESLRIDILLEINKTKVKIPGGNIKFCELNLYSYGFDGRLGFGLFSDESEDKLFPLFITQDVIKVNLSIIRVYNIRDKSPVPIIIEAYVTKKSIRESVYEKVKKGPVLQRYYEISFQDIPAVLWKQHFPVKLYTDKKISDVLKEHAVDKVSLEIDEKIKEETNDMIFLGLEKKHDQASFYDFFIWYVKFADIVLVYDYSDAKLKIVCRNELD